MQTMSTIIEILQERGLIEASTNQQIKEIAKQPLKVYCGFDPTADSLHLGNLVAMMGLAWFQRLGHTPVVVLGGAIGDPTDRSTERKLLDEETLKINLEGISKNFDRILKFDTQKNQPLILNNYDWFKSFTFIRFLRDFGKFFRMGPMLSKESVKKRLQSEDGMSYTEFAYQVLQGYDFLHLYETHGFTVQLGGSDQWGNITAGTELIRKVHATTCFGLTFPLLTKSDGQKFGKSETGAIWLSEEKLSVYDFYQYLIRVEDDDVIKLMRMLTFMDMEEIYQYAAAMKKEDYVPRTAQKKLALEVTSIVHGQAKTMEAIEITQNLAPGSQTKLDAVSLNELSKQLPNYEANFDETEKKKLVDLLVELQLLPSKSEARKLIKNGGVYINNEKVIDENCFIEQSYFIANHLMLLAIGKKKKVLIKFKSI